MISSAQQHELQLRNKKNIETLPKQTLIASEHTFMIQYKLLIHEP